MSKSEVQSTSQNVSLAGDTDHQSEDYDLSQFGYKAELEVGTNGNYQTNL